MPLYRGFFLGHLRQTSVTDTRQPVDPTYRLLRAKPRCRVVPGTRLRGVRCGAENAKLRQYDGIKCSAEGKRGLRMAGIGGAPENKPRSGNVSGLQIFLAAPHQRG